MQKKIKQTSYIKAEPTKEIKDEKVIRHRKSSIHRIAFTTLENMHDITDSLKFLLHISNFLNNILFFIAFKIDFNLIYFYLIDKKFYLNLDLSFMPQPL